MKIFPFSSDTAEFRKASDYLGLAGLHSFNKTPRPLRAATPLQDDHQVSTAGQQHAPKRDIFTSNSCSSTELPEFRKLTHVFEFLSSLRMFTTVCLRS